MNLTYLLKELLPKQLILQHKVYRYRLTKIFFYFYKNRKLILQKHLHQYNFLVHFYFHLQLTERQHLLYQFQRSVIKKLLYFLISIKNPLSFIKIIHLK